MLTKNKKSEGDELDTPPNNYFFRLQDAFLFIVGLITYLLDVGLDSYTAYKHWYHGDRHWSYMTITFMVVPSVIVSIASFWWYYMDEKEKEEMKETSRLKWCIRMFFVVFQLAPAIRYIESVILGMRSRTEGKKGNRDQQKRNYVEMLNEEGDCCFLRLIESFLEAIPQLVLQLYILCLVRNYEYKSNMIYLLWLSCLSSLVNVAWSMTAYSRGCRYVDREKTNITWGGSFVLLLWQCGTIGSRVIIFVIFSLIFGKWIFLLFGIHSLLMFLWLMARSCWCKNINCYVIFIYAILSIMYLFSFINDKDEKTRMKYAFYYVVCALENVIMVLLCVFFSDPNVWYLYSGIIGHYTFFVIGLAAMTIYYSTLHPTLIIPDRNTYIEEEPNVSRSSP